MLCFWLTLTSEKSGLPQHYMIPGYLAPIRRDNNGHQGSVLVYMSVNVPAQHRQDLEPANSEIIVVELQKYKSSNL